MAGITILRDEEIEWKNDRMLNFLLSLLVPAKLALFLLAAWILLKLLTQL